MGEVVFQVLHSPCNTLEPIGVPVTDRSRGEEPVLLLSGGALLVGDDVRPDLLGGAEAIDRHGEVIGKMFQERILTLPDYVEVYPTHVSGSLCGEYREQALHDGWI